MHRSSLLGLMALLTVLAVACASPVLTPPPAPTPTAAIGPAPTVISAPPITALTPVLALPIVIVATPTPAAPPTLPPPPTPTPFTTTITVIGEGKVTARPDLVITTFTVRTFDIEAIAAYTSLQTNLRKLTEVLTLRRIEDKDVLSSQLSVQPVYGSQRVESVTPDGKKVESYTSVLQGYAASTQVNVKIRQLREVARITDDVVSQTAGIARPTALQFTLEEPVPYEREARAKALEDAAARAKQLAEGTRLRILRAEGVSESRPGVGSRSFSVPAITTPTPYPAPVPATPAPVPPVPVPELSPGELEVKVFVTVTYRVSE